MSDGAPDLPASMSEDAQNLPTPSPEPAQPPVNEALGGAEIATQRFIESRPTHVIWRDDAAELVHPEGYTPGLLEPLPPGFWDMSMKPDLEARTFVPDLEGIQAAKWSEVKTRREALENGVAPTPFGPSQCDDRSKLKISGLVQMALIAAAAGQPFEEEFTLADNSVALLTGRMAVAMGLAVGRHVSSLHATARALRAMIFAEHATAAGVMAIDVDAAFADSILEGAEAI